MTRNPGIVGNDYAVSKLAVMGYVGVGHDEVAVTNGRVAVLL